MIGFWYSCEEISGLFACLPAADGTSEYISFYKMHFVFFLSQVSARGIGLYDGKNNMISSLMTNLFFFSLGSLITGDFAESEIHQAS